MMSTRHAMGLYWVPEHAGLWGNEIADRLARGGSVQRFVRPEPFLGVSRQSVRRRMKLWMEEQHLALCRSPCSTLKQTQELISGPNRATRVRLVSFNRTQSRVVIGLLTSWCRVVLEKLTGLQLVKKFPTFYGTRWFITALTSVRHLSLS